MTHVLYVCSSRVMRMVFSIFLLLLFIVFPFGSVGALESDEIILKYVSGCNLDFDQDGKLDIALLVDTRVGVRELIVLVKRESDYKSYILATGNKYMYMSCHFGNEIKETSAGKGERENITHRTNGVYLEVKYLEASSVAYFWDYNGFKEVWTSD